ncbi:MAG: alkane 1-monooxygenase [Paracoccaceae bacterium]|nr:alkane 1-monooxygenase [Paracoccaceae bacterium]
MSAFVKPTLSNALPFWSVLAFVPLAVIGPLWGGLWVLALPIAVWQLVPLLDFAVGSDDRSLDPDTPEADIFWHRAATLIWPALQTAIIFGSVAYVTSAAHLGTLEAIVIFLGVGILSGAVGIVFAHELMHQSSRFERWLGDVLMTQTLYGHFRSEHLIVHHAYVGTPRDPVTARLGEGFHAFFLRVLPQCLASAWNAEKARLARKGLPVWDRSNPFWRYGALQLFWLLLALLLGGWAGVLLFAFQALVAVWHLELINYIEHYGLTRKHLGGGRYEPTLPRHSWNDSHTASRAVLINLPRHADHHAKPARRFPLLQTYGPDEAPLMPFGYGTMTVLALVPRLWRRVMNPRVRRWRAMYYPEITDWRPYDRHATPMPR